MQRKTVGLNYAPLIAQCKSYTNVKEDMYFI